MIDQVEVERFKLQILSQIQDEELTNGTAVIEIPAGSEEIANQALNQLKEIFKRRNIKTVVVSDSSRSIDMIPIPINPNDAAGAMSVAYALLADAHAAHCGLNPQVVREAFVKLALGLYSKMSPAEFEEFIGKNYPC